MFLSFILLLQCHHHFAQKHLLLFILISVVALPLTGKEHRSRVYELIEVRACPGEIVQLDQPTVVLLLSLLLLTHLDFLIQSQQFTRHLFLLPPPLLNQAKGQVLAALLEVLFLWVLVQVARPSRGGT